MFGISKTEAKFMAQMLGGIGKAIPAAPQHPTPAQWPDDRVTAAWLGHATVLIHFHGIRIVTDPVLYSRVGIRIGPFTLGPKRHVRAAITAKELLPLDLILLSHAHMDHFDLRTLSRLPKSASVVTARQTGDLLAPLKFQHVQELGWKESVRMETDKGALTVTAFQLRHWGARVRKDDYRGYNAYLLERDGIRIFYAGDTAYQNLTDLRERLGGVDIFIAPIGAYHPWVRSHCTPEEAVCMANEIGAKFILPIHFGTFKLSWEPMDEPIRRFQDALAGQETRIGWREIGETFTLPQP